MCNKYGKKKVVKGKGGKPAPGSSGTDNADILLNVDEAATMCRMSRSMFYRLCAERKTPRKVKLGRLSRWRRQELRDWMQAGCPDQKRWEAMLKKGK